MEEDGRKNCAAVAVSIAKMAATLKLEKVNINIAMIQESAKLVRKKRTSFQVGPIRRSSARERDKDSDIPHTGSCYQKNKVCERHRCVPGTDNGKGNLRELIMQVRYGGGKICHTRRVYLARPEKRKNSSSSQIPRKKKHVQQDKESTPINKSEMVGGWSHGCNRRES